jgi:hypothetical protein
VAYYNNYVYFFSVANATTTNGASTAAAAATTQRIVNNSKKRTKKEEEEEITSTAGLISIPFSPSSSSFCCDVTLVEVVRHSFPFLVVVVNILMTICRGNWL